MVSAVLKYCSITLLILPPLFTCTSNTGHYFSKLKTAVSDNDHDTIYQLLLQNTTDWWEIACIAAENGNLRMIKYIGEHKPRILEKKNEKNETIGYIAAEHGHPNITEYFLKTTSWGYPYYGILSDDERASLFDLIAKKGYLNCISNHVFEYMNNLERIGRIAADSGHLGIACYVATEKHRTFCKELKGIILTALKNSRKVDQQTLELFGKLAEHWNVNFCPDVIELAASANRTDLIEYLAENRCASFSHEYRFFENLNIAFEKSLVNQRFLECLEKANGTIQGYIEQSKDTICHLAAEYGRLDVIRFMAEKNSSILEKTNAYGETVVGIAGTRGHADIVRYVVRQHPLSVAQYDTSYFYAIRPGKNTSAFHFAIAQSFMDMDTLKYVIEKDSALVTRIDHKTGKTAAHAAAANGNMEILRYLVKTEPSVLSVTDSGSDTILHILAKENTLSKERLAFFVDQGAPIDAENIARKTVGHILADNGHTDLLEYLAEKKPSILTIQDKNGDTILHLLARKNAVTVKNLEFFVDKGASLTLKNNERENIALLATKNDNLEILRYVVKKEPAVLTPGNASVGDQIVEVAVSRGYSNILKLIAKRGLTLLADRPNILFRLSNSSEVLGVLRRLKAACETRITNWDRPHFEKKVLHEVVEYEYINIFEFMEYDVNLVSDKGEPLIFSTVRRNRSSLFHYLAENRRTNLTALDREGNNILFIAAMNHDLKKMQYILDTLKVPIDIEWRNNEGNTILHVSVNEALSRLDKARDVHEQAAAREARRRQAAREDRRDYYYNGESNSKDSEEELATHQFQEVHEDAMDVIKYLVEEKHARVNARGHNNKTVLHWATSRTNYDISNYLLNHGADPKLRDADEQNFFQMLHFPSLKANKTGR